MSTFRTPYTDNPRVQHEPIGDSLTLQSEKDGTDLKNILAGLNRHDLQKGIEALTAEHYGDFTTVDEFKEAVDFIQEAQGQFMELPAALRHQFQNDPGQFYEFVTNPENREKAQEMGLIEQDQPPRKPADEPNEPPVGDPTPEPQGQPRDDQGRFTANPAQGGGQ